MGADFSTIHSANEAVQHAAREWQLVQDQLKDALHDTGKLEVALKEVENRYGTAHSGSGFMNKIKQWFDVVRAKIKGTSVHEQTANSLRRLRDYVKTFKTGLETAKTEGSDSLDDLKKKVGVFEEELKKLDDLIALHKEKADGPTNARLVDHCTASRPAI